MSTQAVAEGSSAVAARQLEDVQGASRPGSSATIEGDSSHGKIRISKLGTNYLVFDVKDVALLRRLYGMSGVLTGIVPQAPNQNVLGGLPLQLTAHDVSWLVQDLNVAYIANDWEAHQNYLIGAVRRRENLWDPSFFEASSLRRESEVEEQGVLGYMAGLRLQRQAAQARLDAEQAKREAESARLKAANAEKSRKVKAERKKKKVGGAGGENDSWVVLADPAKNEATDASTTASTEVGSESEVGWPTDDEDKKSSKGKGKEAETAETEPVPVRSKPLVHITPTASTGLVGGSVDADAAVPLPARSSPAEVSADALRTNLAENGYYTTPGLRFGGDMSVYPGDPLRYHAHFVATSYGWDEPIDMLELVSTGRLATGVKKGLLIGGAKPADDEQTDACKAEDSADGSSADGSSKNDCRSFTLEWAAI